MKGIVVMFHQKKKRTNENRNKKRKLIAMNGINVPPRKKQKINENKHQRRKMNNINNRSKKKQKINQNKRKPDAEIIELLDSDDNNDNNDNNDNDPVDYDKIIVCDWQCGTTKFQIRNLHVDSLQDKKELREEIIDFGAKYEWDNWSTSFKKKTRIFETSWYQRYITYKATSRCRKYNVVDHKKIQKCVNKIKNLWELDYLIFLRYDCGHYALIIVKDVGKIWNRQKWTKYNQGWPKIIILDSLAGTRKMEMYKTEINNIKIVLTLAFGNTACVHIDDLPVLIPDVPVQTNAVDCGLYTLKNLQIIGEQKGFKPNKFQYDVRDIEEYKNKLLNIINELKKKKLKYNK